jgi:hypothetical protein
MMVGSAGDSRSEKKRKSWTLNVEISKKVLAGQSFTGRRKVQLHRKGPKKLIMKRLARVRSTTRNIHGRNGESGGTFLEATAEVTEVTMCGIPTRPFDRCCETRLLNY